MASFALYNIYYLHAFKQTKCTRLFVIVSTRMATSIRLHKIPSSYKLNNFIKKIILILIIIRQNKISYHIHMVMLVIYHNKNYIRLFN